MTKKNKMEFYKNSHNASNRITSMKLKPLSEGSKGSKR